MNKPFFSIIIPTFNRSARIRQTLESVLKQTDPDFEVIVMDDGGTDDTASVVQSFSDPRIIYRWKENGERASARNAGVKIGQGQYVTFLDSDDRLYPDHLKIVRQSLLTLNSPAVYHQAYELIEESGRVVSRLGIRSGLINGLLFTRGNVMSCQGVFLSHDVARENPFNESRDLSGVEDWELWIRMAARYDIRHSDTITSALVQHPERSVVQSNPGALRKRMKAFREIVEANAEVSQKYARLLPGLWANVSTYLALHLSEIPGNKAAAANQLFYGVARSPGVLLHRRAWAIIRNILLR